MKRQKSFEGSKPTLYVVATPIGNLQEMSPRAIEVLQCVDVIAAEDTRNTMKLLHHFQIHTRLIAHHMHNERESAKGIIQLLEQGKSIALVSDAGYPLISDPGLPLTQQVIKAGYPVVPVSGSNAMLDALVARGLPTKHVLFHGFLPSADKERIRELHDLRFYPQTLVFYEAPHRVLKTLKNMLEILGNRDICIAREITKKHEEFLRGSLSELSELEEELKGEMVIVVAGASESCEPAAEMPMIRDQIHRYIKEGCTTNEAIRRVAKQYGLSRNDVYREFHELN